jgi:hypothetical protein
MIRRLLITAILPVLFVEVLNSQTIINPNYSLKSHETLRIIKIELKPEAAIFYMSIENRIENGTFCADRNIFLIYSDGKKSKLISASDIPVCPDAHVFKSPGEKLDFVLTFPPIARGVEWVDLVEECNENCFSFYGITLETDLNERIDNAFRLAENDETSKALASFIALADELRADNHGIMGLLYINIIKLAAADGDYKKAGEWYRKFKSSDAPRVEEYLKHLNDQGIRY